MVLTFFGQHRPWDLLKDLIISCCIVPRFNGMVINIFYDSSFCNFWIKFQIFGKFSCSKCMDLYEPVELFQA